MAARSTRVGLLLVAKELLDQLGSCTQDQAK